MKDILSYEKEDGGYVVTGCRGGKGRNVEIPSVFSGLPVVGVGEKAFCGSGITGVTIPPSVKFIRSGAFSGCPELRYANVSDLEAWCGVLLDDAGANPGCASDIFLVDGKPAIDLVIPEGVERIEAYTFAGCRPVASVTLSKSLKSAGECAFCGYSRIGEVINLSSADVFEKNFANGNLGAMTYAVRASKGDSRVAVDGDGFVFFDGGEKRVLLAYMGKGGDVALPEPGKEGYEIAEGAFAGLKNITAVSIPEGLPKIPFAAFRGSYGLKRVFLPESVVSVGDEAFAECVALKSFSFPEGVTDIGDRVFYMCRSLEKVSLPSGLKEIPHGMFQMCDSLKRVKIPAAAEEIGGYAFDGCAGLEKIDFPENLKRIGDSAFFLCRSLKELNLRPGLLSIGEGAFGGCDSLKSVIVPEGVTEIGRQAFSLSDSLEFVRLPEGVKIIEDCLFSGCPSLTEVVLPKSVTEIKRGAFDGCRSLAKIFFCGGYEEWNEIDVAEDGNGDFFQTEICFLNEITL